MLKAIMNDRWWRLGLFALLTFAAEASAEPPLALSGPIEVQANTLVVDEKAGRAQYAGSVHVVQGGATMDAETLTVETENGKVSRLTAKGSPVIFSVPEEQRTARAETVVYEPAQGVLTLTGKAELRQGGDLLSGAKIIYDLQNRSGSAVGDGQSRVRSVLQTEPFQKKDKQGGGARQ